jgi:hypothetical protein
MSQETKIQVVTEEHAIYTKMQYLWQFYMDSYQGGYRYRENAAGVDSSNAAYLFKHESEDDKSNKYETRRIRSFFDNWCRMPINLYLKYIFSERYPIERTSTKLDIFNPYIKNYNIRGKDTDAFMRWCGRNMLIFGVYYILVDRPPLPSYVQSKADETKLGIRSYPTGISPLQLTNWSMNPYTREYDWIVIKVVDYQNRDWKTESASESTYYYLWTPDEIYYTDSGGNLVDPKDMPIEGTPNPTPNKLGFVPLVRMTYSDVDNDDHPESFLMDIAEINRSIYNIDSMYDEELYKLCFAQLMKPKSDQKFTEYDVSQNQNILSVDKVIEYPEGGPAPSYLIPPVKALVEKRARKNELIQDIMRLANLGSESGVASDTYQSGIAMSFAYSDTHLTAAQIAGQAEQAEREVWEIIRMWDDLTPEIQVDYPKKFDIRADLEDRENYKALKENMGKSPTLQVALDIKEGKRSLDEDEKFWKTVEDELEAGYETEDELDKTLINELQPNEEKTIQDQGIAQGIIITKPEEEAISNGE